MRQTRVAAVFAAVCVVSATPPLAGADGMPCDDSSWRGLTYQGAVFDSGISAITSWGSPGQAERLVVAARFTRPAPMAGEMLGAWDGTNWTPLPGWPAGRTITAFGTWNGLLVAVADAESPATAPWNNVGVYDGVSWRMLGQGFQWQVRSIAEHDGALYVGGTMRIGNQNSLVAKWDDPNWVSVAANDAGGVGMVNALQSRAGALYVGGDFARIDGVESTNIAEFRGGVWRALPAINEVFDLDVFERDLVAATSIASIPSTADGVMRLSDSGGVASWGRVYGNSPTRTIKTVSALAVRDNEMVVVGLNYNIRCVGPNFNPCSILWSDSRDLLLDRFSGGVQTALATSSLGPGRPPSVPFESRLTRLGSGYVYTFGQSIRGVDAGPLPPDAPEDAISSPIQTMSALAESGWLAGEADPLVWAGLAREVPCVEDAWPYRKLVVYRGRLLSSTCGPNDGEVLEYNGNAFVPNEITQAGVIGKSFASSDRLFLLQRVVVEGQQPHGWLLEWDGAAWQRVGSALWGSVSPPDLDALAASEAGVYVHGTFRLTPDGNTPVAAWWNGTAWIPLQFPANFSAHSAISWNDRIFIGGSRRTGLSSFKTVLEIVSGSVTSPAEIPTIDSGGGTSLVRFVGSLGRYLGLVTNDRLYTFDGNEIAPFGLTNSFDFWNIHEAATVSGRLFLTGSFTRPVDPARPTVTTAFSQLYLDCRLDAWDGDAGCDEDVSFEDIRPFVLYILNPDAYAAEWPECDAMRADMNLDGVVDVDDIPGLVRRLLDR